MDLNGAKKVVDKDMQFAFWSVIKEICAIDLLHKYTTLILYLLCEHRFGGEQE